MNTKQLTLDDLVKGLEFFGSRYDALDVFARDIKTLGRDDQRDPGVYAVTKDSITFDRGGKTYKLRIHGQSGVARLTRTSGSRQGLSNNQVTMGLLGAALGATALDDSLPSALVGFLVGAALGDASDAPKRVFTMSYDPATRRWGSYDGPLSSVVREKRREAEIALAKTA